jgi:hypothetical protein
LTSHEQTPVDKVLHERQLSDAMRDKVIARSIRVTVDGPWPGTMPAEVLLEATRKLVRDLSNQEVTPYTIDRMLEDVVIEDGWGSFYWDSENKRHLKLNPPGWKDQGKNNSPPQKAGYTLGDLSGVYGGDKGKEPR